MEIRHVRILLVRTPTPLIRIHGRVLLVPTTLTAIRSVSSPIFRSTTEASAA